MDEKKMKELMIDYIDGKLSGELKAFVEKYIEKSAEHQREYKSLKETVGLLQYDKQLEPDSNFRLDFLNALEQEMNTSNEDVQAGSIKIIRLRLVNVWQVAAAVALLAVGVLGGMWLMKDNSHQKQMIALRQEMEQTKKMVMLALEDQNSPSQRMLGVNASYELPRVDDEIVQILVKTMNEDENVNVRLAAINALAKFSAELQVRKALIASLDKQTDPIVQITLINLMVELKEKGAVEELKQIINDSTNVESVKDEAHMAVFKLS